LATYRQQEECVSFQNDECIRTVRPAYQRLVSQLDDHLGRLFAHMAGSDRLADTVQKVPMIVVDPRPAADSTRGGVEQRFVASVDVVPTVLEALGIARPTHRLAGASLLPLLHGQPAPSWRDFTYSELDYSYRQARLTLGKHVHQCRAFSLRNERWRYVYWLDEPEQLFDLQADPDEFQDLGREAVTAEVRTVLRTQLLDFLGRRRHRSTVRDGSVERGTGAHKKAGVYFGQW
jgi:arylsulfatase A-like enzyme